MNALIEAMTDGRDEVGREDAEVVAAATETTEAVDAVAEAMADPADAAEAVDAAATAADAAVVTADASTGSDCVRIRTARSDRRKVVAETCRLPSTRPELDEQRDAAPVMVQTAAKVRRLNTAMRLNPIV